MKTYIIFFAVVIFSMALACTSDADCSGDAWCNDCGVCSAGASGASCCSDSDCSGSLCCDYCSNTCTATLNNCNAHTCLASTTTTTSTTKVPSTATTTTSSSASSASSGSSTANPCDSETSGDWCYEGGYVSCPSPTLRPCQAGLVCEQDSPGVVYCVYPPGTTSTTKVASVATTTTTSAKAATTTTTSAKAATTTTTSAKAATTTTTTTTTSTTHVGTTTTTGTSTSWPSGPVKAIYIDDNCWATSFSFNTLVDSGFNLVILAFFVTVNGALTAGDCASAWGGLTSTQQLTVKSYYSSHGAKLIVSGGGATESPYQTFTGTSYGTQLATWAVSNNLDGCDFDLENFGAGFTYGSLTTAQTVAWVADATNAARTYFNNNGLTNAIITHAPQPPYFGADNGFNNGYGQVYAAASSINFMLVQFYDNGPLTTYSEIFESNSAGDGVEEMVANDGIPLSKIVVGKAVTSTDADTDGYDTASQLYTIFQTALTNIGWNTGVMGWQWHDSTTNGNWISTIYP